MIILFVLVISLLVWLNVSLLLSFLSVLVGLVRWSWYCSWVRMEKLFSVSFNVVVRFFIRLYW